LSTLLTNNRLELPADLEPESEFYEVSHQVCPTRRGLHFAIDLSDLAVLVDVKGPPLGILSRVVQHSVAS